MSAETPLVSIIIPTLNRAHLIGDTLDSVLAQTYQNWECIVVDDGGSDNTDAVMAEYMAKDSRFQYHHRPKDRLPGGNAARNYGFEISKGEYIQWFDSDDLMIPEKLEIQVNELITNHRKIHLCSGKKFNANTNSYKDLKINLQDNFFRQIALNTSEIMTPSLLIERETYCASKVCFLEKLSRGQETYFLINLITKIDTNLIYQSEKKLFEYIFHDQSITKSDEVYKTKHVMSKAIVFSHIWSLNKNYGYEDVANKMYRKSIRLLFSSLRNKDYQTSKSILALIKVNLKNDNSQIYFKVLMNYLFLRIFKFPKYRLMNNLLNIKISP